MAAMRAMKIRELLDHILSMMDDYGDAGDLACCARVCRDWELPALRHLWRDSPPAHALFGLLGDLSSMEPVVSTSFVLWIQSDIAPNCV